MSINTTNKLETQINQLNQDVSAKKQDLNEAYEEEKTSGPTAELTNRISADEEDIAEDKQQIDKFMEVLNLLGHPGSNQPLQV